jgi:hypothetical protein
VGEADLAGGRLGERDRAVARGEDVERDPGFEPRETGTEAVVDAVAEREVLVV